MRNLLEEREDDLANSIKELNEKCQEAQRLKVRNWNYNPNISQYKRNFYFYQTLGADISVFFKNIYF